ncbi:MAG: hypothetical protein N3D10_01315 [Candidatus Micrarchaeota archaeon]|nr:hypothetical protein [Candidatus Micrarchaeota archaeon]
MKWIEKKLKSSKIRPLRVLGEIIFGTAGEVWEDKKLFEEVYR